MITVQHSHPSVTVIATLDAVIAVRGQPVQFSLDNESESRSRVFDGWAADRGIALVFIRPDEPLQNEQIDSCNGRLRDECLNQHYLWSLNYARFHIERWRLAYNEERPHGVCLP